jgi:hypothetical protein
VSGGLVVGQVKFLTRVRKKRMGVNAQKVGRFRARSIGAKSWLASGCVLSMGSEAVDLLALRTRSTQRGIAATKY